MAAPGVRAAADAPGPQTLQRPQEAATRRLGEFGSGDAMSHLEKWWNNNGGYHGNNYYHGGYQWFNNGGK